MLRTRITVISALIAVFAMTCIAPAGAFADSTQNNKNLWRNLTIGAVAVAGLGLITHNNTEAIAGVVGAVYSDSRYEQERQTQSQQQNWWRNNGYRYNNNRGYNGNYNDSGYGQNGYYNGSQDCR